LIREQALAFAGNLSRHEEVFYKEGEEWKIESKMTTYLHDDFKINVDVPDSIFCIKLPEGLKWFDTRIGKEVEQPD